MLTTLQNAFKIKDIRKKTTCLHCLMLVVIRIGSQLPVPGVNTAYFASTGLRGQSTERLTSLMHLPVALSRTCQFSH